MVPLVSPPDLHPGRHWPQHKELFLGYCFVLAPLCRGTHGANTHMRLEEQDRAEPQTNTWKNTHTRARSCGATIRSLWIGCSVILEVWAQGRSVWPDARTGTPPSCSLVRQFTCLHNAAHSRQMKSWRPSKCKYGHNISPGFFFESTWNGNK